LRLPLKAKLKSLQRGEAQLLAVLQHQRRNDAIRVTRNVRCASISDWPDPTLCSAMILSR
jgi:hypothetical protein